MGPDRAIDKGSAYEENSGTLKNISIYTDLEVSPTAIDKNNARDVEPEYSIDKESAREELSGTLKDSSMYSDRQVSPTAIDYSLDRKDRGTAKDSSIYPDPEVGPDRSTNNPSAQEAGLNNPIDRASANQDRSAIEDLSGTLKDSSIYSNLEVGPDYSSDNQPAIDLHSAIVDRRTLKNICIYSNLEVGLNETVNLSESDKNGTAPRHRSGIDIERRNFNNRSAD